MTEKKLTPCEETADCPYATKTKNGIETPCEDCEKGNMMPPKVSTPPEAGKKESQQPTKFRKKPVVVEAVQWDGSNLDKVLALLPKQEVTSTSLEPLAYFHFQTRHSANVGDWIIKGTRGEFYVCKPDTFAQTYEAIGEQPAQHGIERIPGKAKEFHDWYYKQLKEQENAQPDLLTDELDKLVEKIYVRSLDGGVNLRPEVIKLIVQDVIAEGYHKDQPVSGELREEVIKILCDDCFNHQKNHDCNQIDRNACYYYLADAILAKVQTHYAGYISPADLKAALEQERRKVAEEIMKYIERFSNLSPRDNILICLKSKYLSKPEECPPSCEHWIHGMGCELDIARKEGHEIPGTCPQVKTCGHANARYEGKDGIKRCRLCQEKYQATSRPLKP